MLSEKPGSRRWETLESSLFASLPALVLFPRCSSCPFAILVTKTCFSSASNLRRVDYFSLREKDLLLILKIITRQCREGELCIRWLPAVRCMWATVFHSGKVMAETGLFSEHCTQFKPLYSGVLCCFSKIEARWRLFKLLPQCRKRVLVSPVFRYLESLWFGWYFTMHIRRWEVAALYQIPLRFCPEAPEKYKILIKRLHLYFVYVISAIILKTEANGFSFIGLCVMVARTCSAQDLKNSG